MSIIRNIFYNCSIEAEVRYRMRDAYFKKIKKSELLNSEIEGLSVVTTCEKILSSLPCNDLGLNQIKYFQKKLKQINVDEDLVVNYYYRDGCRICEFIPVFAYSRPYGSANIILWPLQGYHYARDRQFGWEIKKHDCGWQSKINKAIWRGAVTGSCFSENRTPGKANRLELVKKFAFDEDVDAKFTTIHKMYECRKDKLMKAGFFQGLFR
jgi:hypothetical protein